MRDTQTTIWLFPPFPIRCFLPGLHDLTASVSTVCTDWTRAEPFTQVNGLDDGSVGADKKRGMIVFAELNINEVFLPADWAVSNVLFAH